MTTLKEKGPQQQNNCVLYYVQCGENYQGVKFIVKKVLDLTIWNSVAGRHYEILFTFLTFLNIFCRNKEAKYIFDAQLERERESLIA